VAAAAPVAAPAAAAAPAVAPVAAAAAPAAASPVVWDVSIPHTVETLSNLRKTIARRLTEAKSTIPHIYLPLDIRLYALLKLRGE
ncbi:2-oxo acid dehydrogenase subunit E2, partial [Acinetobacter baumannii]